MQDLVFAGQPSLDHQAVADCLDDGLDPTPPDTQDKFAREMRWEQARAQTFGRSWPSKWGKQLSSYGFYCVRADSGSCSVRSERCVRCAFCGLEIRGFTSPKDAKLQHWQAARGYCPFLQGQDVGNVRADDKENVAPQAHHYTTVTTTSGGVENFPRTERVNHLGATPASVPHHTAHHSLVFINPWSSQDMVTSPARHTAAVTSQRTENHPFTPAGNTQQQQSSSTWRDLVRTARYPQMASFQARLDSLRTWPLLTPTARDLARAGLFHVKCHRHPDTPAGHHGNGRYKGECADSVKCFWCGERFHRWQESDDAMLEHARLSPRCRYVTQILGRQLHDDIIKAGSSHLDNRLFTRDDPQPTVDEVMASPQVQRVLQMGFPYQLVRDLLGHNPQRLTPDTLCDLVLHAAHRRQEDLRATTPSFGGTRASEREREGEETVPLTTNFNYGQSSSPARNEEPLPPWQHRVSAWDPTLTPAEVTGPPCPPSAPPLTSDRRVTCKVCSEEEVKVTFRPCNHLVCCSKCARFFSHCPVCQRLIEDRLTTYLA